jgi:F-type H+-transporting ATPase subunit delta
MSSVQNQLYARPYAEAAFHYAKQHSAISSWSAFLILFAEVFAKAPLCTLLTDPFVHQTELVEAITTLLPGQLDQHQIFFLQLLAKNHRVIYLTSIAAYFALLRDQDENILRVTVSSAYAMDDASTARLKQKLADQFKKQIFMEIKIQPDLIGGLKIQIGDRVLDLSVQDRLSQLIQSLSQSDQLRNHA